VQLAVENALQSNSDKANADADTDAVSEKVRLLISSGLDERFAELDNLSVIRGDGRDGRAGTGAGASFERDGNMVVRAAGGGVHNSTFGPALTWLRAQLSHSLVRSTVLLLMTLFGVLFVFRLFGVRGGRVVPVVSEALGAVEWGVLWHNLRVRVERVILALHRMYKGTLWKWHGLDPEL
jgi:hypothetical protein